MATPEEVIKVILKKLVAGATDKDIEALVQALEGSEKIKVQIAKILSDYMKQISDISVSLLT